MYVGGHPGLLWGPNLVTPRANVVPRIKMKKGTFTYAWNIFEGITRDEAIMLA